jgi:hypothetical protein
MTIRRFFRAIAFAGSLVATMAAVFIIGLIFLTPDGVDQTVDLDVLQTAVERVGVSAADFQTMVVGATRETDVSPEVIWRVLTDMENWSNWYVLTRERARWIDGFQWVPGAQFQHQVELGFPLGSARSTAFVERVSPGRSLLWVEQRRGALVCHIWQISPIPNGGSRITCIEASRGMSTAVTKFFTIGPLQRTFEETVSRLIEYATDTKTAAVSNPSIAVRP